MSERPVSTPAALSAHIGWRRFAAMLAGSIAVTAVLILAAGGSGALANLTAFARAAEWTPHAPDFSQLAGVSLAIQIHLAAVVFALGVGLFLMSGVKGTRLHRTLGWGWVIAMALAAAASLFIRQINHGAFSFLHLFAGWTLIGLPFAVLAARRHNVKAHSRFMTGLFTGGLLVAGAFAFMPGRLMWRIFFG